MAIGASILTGVLQLMGVVAVVLVGLAFFERNGRKLSATLFALIWGLLVFLPLVWGILGGQGAWYVDVLGAYDFAGALPFQIGGGIALLAIAALVPQTSGRSSPLERVKRRIPSMLLLVLTIIGWTAWLVFMELDLNTYVLKIIGNTLALALGSLFAALAVQRIRTGAITANGAAIGVLTGLAAASGSCAFLEPLAAGAIGVITGALAGLIAFPRGRMRVATIAGVGAVSQLVGGAGGLLLLGLLDQSRGFFYTGQFGLPIAQLSALLACALYAAVIAFPLALLMRRRRAEAVVEG